MRLFLGVGQPGPMREARRGLLFQADRNAFQEGRQNLPRPAHVPDVSGRQGRDQSGRPERPGISRSWLRGVNPVRSAAMFPGFPAIPAPRRSTRTVHVGAVGISGFSTSARTSARLLPTRETQTSGTAPPRTTFLTQIGLPGRGRLTTQIGRASCRERV